MTDTFGDLARFLIDPGSGETGAHVTDKEVRFANGASYPVIDGVPILIPFGGDGVSRTDDVVQGKHQGIQSLRRKSVGSRVKNMLPGLYHDWTWSARQSVLRPLPDIEGPVLVLGAGSKAESYRKRFLPRKVLITDVERVGAVDMCVDATAIPFSENVFSLVFSAQVMEHVADPAAMARGCERVVKYGGHIHVEVPYLHHTHSRYDFYRYTPAGLRWLFRNSELIGAWPLGGPFGAATLALHCGISQLDVPKTVGKILNASSRLGFWWLKYLDRLHISSSSQRIPSSAVGFAMTFRYDGVARSLDACLRDVDAIAAT